METKLFPRIVLHLKQRFQRDREENYPISLEEIIDEINPSDHVPQKIRSILDTQMLPANPKLETIIEDGVRKFKYKPLYNVSDRKGIINLIRETQTKGLGGIPMENIQESLTTAEFDRIFKKPSEDIVILSGKGKQKILYYNDKSSPENIQVELDITKMWNNVSVDGLDETKIAEYLERQGLSSMKDPNAAMAASIQPVKRKQSTKGRQIKKHNEHLGNVLNEYDPDLVKKPNKP